MKPNLSTQLQQLYHIAKPTGSTFRLNHKKHSIYNLFAQKMKKFAESPNKLLKHTVK